jgi:hypothetical protein
VDYSAVCHEFISFNKTKDVWGTCAVMDCSQMENLASAVKAKLSEWQDALSSVSMQNVQQYGAYGWGRDYRYFSYDLLDFFRELGRKSGVKNLDLNEAVSTVQSALNQAVIAKDCLSGTDYEFDGVIVDEARFCGIGMYIPKEYNPYVANKTAWNDYYEQSIDRTRSFGAAMDYGVVRVDAGNSGLIQSVSPMTMLGASAWMKMELSKKEVVTVSVRLPMTPVSGSATVRAPVARTMEGDIVYASEKVSLAQRPTEVALFATYGKQFDRASALFGHVSMQYSTISNKLASAAQVTYAWYF